MASSHVQITTTYPLLKDMPFSLPERSRYTHLEPIGIDTPTVESLTSYVCRLAAAHNISVGTLYEFEIVPSLNKSYLVSPPHLGPASTLLGSFRNQIKNINGIGQVALEWAELLGRMTLQKDLKYLTFLPWSEVLTYKKLLRRSQAWCPACYGEMQHTSSGVYQPLIWSIELIRICTRHHIRLVDRCISCNQQFSFLTRRLKLGFCPRCENWLGRVTKNSNENLFTPTEIQWQEFIIDNMGDLLTFMSSKAHNASKHCIARWLQICADRLTQGKMQRLSRILSKSNLTVHEWRHGRFKPILFDLLRICYCLDVRLIDLLTGNNIEREKSFTAKQFPQELEPIKQVRRANFFSYPEIEKQLINYVKISPPPSLRKVSVEVGHDRSTLLKWFPDLCNKISQRYKEFLQAYYKTQRDKRELEVQRACMELHKRQIYPSAGNVAEFLGKPSYAGRRDVTAVVKATRKQLGTTKK